MKYFHFYLTNPCILPPLISEVTEKFEGMSQKWEGKTVNHCHQVGKHKTVACASELVLSLRNPGREETWQSALLAAP